MAWPLVVGAALSVVGQVMGAEAGVDAAKKRRAELNRQAGNVRASSHRRAWDERKAGERAVSRAYAMVGAQGGTSDDVGITNIVGAITGQAVYNELVQLWDGDDKARQLITTGQTGVDEAKDKRTAAYISAAGSVMQFAGTAAGGGFGKNTATPKYNFGADTGQALYGT